MKTQIEKRVNELIELAMTYDESKRAFIKDNIRIYVDVVEYGNPILYDKHLKKVK